MVWQCTKRLKVIWEVKPHFSPYFPSLYPIYYYKFDLFYQQRYGQICPQQISNYTNNNNNNNNNTEPNIESRSTLYETKTDTPEQLQRRKKHSITPESLKNSRKNSLLPCSGSTSRLGSKNTQRSGLPSSLGTVDSVSEDLLPMTTALTNEVWNYFKTFKHLYKLCQN